MRRRAELIAFHTAGARSSLQTPACALLSALGVLLLTACGSNGSPPNPQSADIPWTPAKREAGPASTPLRTSERSNAGAHNGGASPAAFIGEFDNVQALKAVYGSYDAARQAAPWKASDVPAGFIPPDSSWCGQGPDALVRAVSSKTRMENGIETRVLITAAMPVGFDGAGRDCSPIIGVAVFAKKADEWRAIEITRYALMAGEFGNAPPLEWTRIGPDLHALVVHTEDNREDDHHAFVAYIKDGDTYSRPVLNIADIMSRTGIAASLEFVPGSSKPLFDATLTTSTKSEEGSAGAATSHRAQFSYENGRYVQVSNSGVPCTSPGADSQPGERCLFDAAGRFLTSSTATSAKETVTLVGQWICRGNGGQITRERYGPDGTLFWELAGDPHSDAPAGRAVTRFDGRYQTAGSAIRFQLTRMRMEFAPQDSDNAASLASMGGGFTRTGAREVETTLQGSGGSASISIVGSEMTFRTTSHIKNGIESSRDGPTDTCSLADGSRLNPT